MKIVDLQINIDGLVLGGGDSVEGFINKVEKLVNSAYPITYEILYEEER